MTALTTGPVVVPPPALEEVTYWKVGDGLPASGGCCGVDYVWKDADDQVVATQTGKPGAAVTITEAEYQTLLAAWQNYQVT